MMELWSKALFMAGPKCPFEKEQVIFESSTPGTYNKEIVNGVYEIWATGGGAGGKTSRLKVGAAGGQGAAIKATIYLTKQILSIVVGSGGYGDGTKTSISNLLICNGGVYGGSGGTLVVNVTLLTNTLASNGNASNTTSLLGNGFGAGGGGGRTSGMNAVRYRGGSAAAFLGIVKLKKGIYPIAIGERGNQGKYISTEGGSSSIGDLIKCGGGVGGFQGAAGGVLSINVEVVSSTIQSNGVAASSNSILGNGYGAGGYGNENNTWGTNGYIKVIYKG